jgi:N-methylhydantoinase A
MDESDRTKLAIDVGGTFTDVVWCDATGATRSTKVRTTSPDITAGILEGARQAGVDLGRLDSFVHGTTIALNALLERKIAPVGLITTSGFRDVLEIMRTNRPNMYDLQQLRPTPLVPRRHRREISARLSYAGEELRPVIAAEVAQIAQDFASAGIRSIAVCLLNAYANPAQEREVRERLAEMLPDAFVSLSSDLSRVWREFERTSTTVSNAAVTPLVARYMESLERQLSNEGFAGEVLIMQSNGGVMSATEARRRPVATLMSGPVGGVIGALGVAKLIGPDASLITLDIGGTSADVAIVDRGEAVSRVVGYIDRWPIMMPMIDIESIGAGGGSLARVDDFGGLTVGPESAGAEPGPACYGRGGTEATVTDANLVLGRINPASFLGGRLALDVSAATQAVTKSIGLRYGMTVERSAEGIVTVINATMRRLLWETLISRGYDPREFKLLAFGGAGPLHACELAQAVGIAEVMVPPEPGTFSASGILDADLRHDLERMLVAVPGLDNAAVERAYRALETEGQARVCGEQRAEVPVTFLRSAELRYLGQDHPLSVEFTEPTHSPLQDAHGLFHAKHERLYGFRRDDVPVELVRVQVAAIGRRPPRGRSRRESGGTQQGKPRRLWADRTWQNGLAYARRDLAPGAVVEGPCVIEEPGSTTYVPPGCQATADDFGILHIQIPVGVGSP